MHAYFFAFFWGLYILCSLLGFGFGLLAFFKKDIKADLGWQGALGIGISVIFGGVLNLAHLISKITLQEFLALGGALFLVSVIVNRKSWLANIGQARLAFKTRKGLAILGLILVALVFVRYSSSVAFYAFHGTDDQHAYMVFPAKMIQTGALGSDPFSERRLASSLGGQSFLDSFVLAGAEFKNYHVIDNGIGLIIFLLVLAGLLKDLKLPMGLSLLVLLTAAVIPSPVGNMTSFYIAAAVFMALCRLALRSFSKIRRSLGGGGSERGLLEREGESRSPWTDLVLLALLSAGVCTLKSNMIAPTVALFSVYFYQCYKAGAKASRTVGELLFAGLLTVLFLLPWMISLKQSSNTWLFPILGRGYDGSQYGNYLSRYLEFSVYSAMRLTSEFMVGLCFFLAFFFLAWVWVKSPSGKEKNTVCLLFLAALIGFLSLIFGMGGYSLYYYSLSFLMPVFFAGLILILKKGEQPIFTGGSRLKALTLGLLVLFFIFGTYVQQDAEIFAATKDSINIDGGLRLGLLNSDLVPPAELKQYTALQSSVPVGATILGRLDRNFMFDFKRNKIFIIDIPGGSALPPGIPFKQGSEALAKYFVSVGVKYVAYSYGNQANFTHLIGDSMLRPHVNPLLRTQAEHAFDLQDSLLELYKNKTRKVIYDDGKNFVMDLSALIF